MREVDRLGRPPHMRGRARRRRGGVRRDGRAPRAGAALAGGLTGPHRSWHLRARGRGDVSGSQVTGGTRLRTHGSRIAAAVFAASLVGAPAHAPREPHVRVILPWDGRGRACARAGAALPSRLAGHGARGAPSAGETTSSDRPGRAGRRSAPSAGETTLALGEPAASTQPVTRDAPPRLVRCPRPDVTWPVAPGCLSRPTGLRRRGAPHPGSHSGGTPSFARATSLGLPKTLGRLGKNSVIGLPNPRKSPRPAATTM